MEEVRPRLEAFAAQMLGSLARGDQRAKGEMYLRGLMLDGKRKSMQPMAERLGVDHQQLQQFVSSSTWDYSKGRERGARWAAAHISPEAYVIDESASPRTATTRRGWHGCTAGRWASVGTARSGSV
jgi:SRSO17 transposase